MTMLGTTRNQSKRMGSNRKDKVPSCLARCARTLSFTAARPGSKLQRRVQRRDLDKSLSVGPFHETCQGQLAIRSIYTAEAVCFSIKWMESKWPGRPWVFEKISSHSSHDRFGRDELCIVNQVANYDPRVCMRSSISLQVPRCVFICPCPFPKVFSSDASKPLIVSHNLCSKCYALGRIRRTSARADLSSKTWAVAGSSVHTGRGESTHVLPTK